MAAESSDAVVKPAYAASILEACLKSGLSVQLVADAIGYSALSEMVEDVVDGRVRGH